jgi:hypothetical protein
MPVAMLVRYFNSCFLSRSDRSRNIQFCQEVPTSRDYTIYTIVKSVERLLLISLRLKAILCRKNVVFAIETFGEINKYNRIFLCINIHVKFGKNAIVFKWTLICGFKFLLFLFFIYLVVNKHSCRVAYYCGTVE